MFLFNSKRGKEKEREKLEKSQGYFKKLWIGLHHTVLSLVVLRWDGGSRTVYAFFFFLFFFSSPCCLKCLLFLPWSLGQFGWNAASHPQWPRPNLGPVARCRVRVGAPQFTSVQGCRMGGFPPRGQHPGGLGVSGSRWWWWWGGKSKGQGFCPHFPLHALHQFYLPFL